jgi:hypothetical protein
MEYVECELRVVDGASCRIKFGVLIGRTSLTALSGDDMIRWGHGGGKSLGAIRGLGSRLEDCSE